MCACNLLHFFWKTIKRLNGKRKCGTSGLHLELFRRKITTKTRSHQHRPRASGHFSSRRSKSQLSRRSQTQFYPQFTHLMRDLLFFFFYLWRGLTMINRVSLRVRDQCVLIFRGAEPRIVMIYSKSEPICGSSRLIRIKKKFDVVNIILGKGCRLKKWVLH